METYVKICQNKGLSLESWRRADMCPMTCPAGKEFKECGFGDSPSCAENSGKNYDLKKICTRNFTNINQYLSQ